MTAKTAELQLELVRRYDATPEQVFDAWLTPALVSRWFSPSDAMQCTVHELDATVGGRYRIEMIEPDDGGHYIVAGEYLRIDRPHELAMSWAWEHQPEYQMLVTIRITADGNGSRLTLLHERLPSDELRTAHDEGWTGCLQRLAALYA